MGIKVLQNTEYAVSHSDAIKMRGENKTLTQKMGEINGDLKAVVEETYNGEAITIPEKNSDSLTKGWTININTSKWTAQTPRQIYFMPYEYIQGDKLQITGNATNGSYVAFLSDYPSSFTEGGDVPYATYQRTSGWESIGSGVTKVFDIPSDCTYILFNAYYDTANYIPVNTRILHRVVKAKLQKDFEALGEKCIKEESEDTKSLVASYGMWQVDGSVKRTKGYLHRAHLLIECRDYDKLILTIPSGWYADNFVVEYNDEALDSGSGGWHSGTYTIELDGIHNVMLNIKYGSEGTTDISQEMCDAAPFGVALQISTGLVPAAPYSDIVKIEERIGEDVPISTILNRCITRTEGGEETLDLKPYFSLGGLDYGSAGNTRLYARFDWKLYKKSTIYIPSGWYIAIQYCDESWVTKINTGWTNEREFNIDEYSNIQITLKDSAEVSHLITNEKIASLTVTSVNTLSKVRCVKAASYPEFKELKDKFPDYTKSYIGEKIMLSHGYNLEDFGSFPNGVNPTQGFAIYGNYCVQGSSTESNGETMACVIDMDSRTKIADLLLSHSGYSAIHCNMMCFGSETIENGIMPLLYASQWDGECCCFVYDVQLNGATLKQVISPANLTKDGIRFGAGYVDWLVDRDHEWLFAISYKNSAYSTGGQIITKFALPKASEGALVELSDNDIIGYNDFGDYIIRQDGCYNNNKLFLIYGSTGVSYVPYLALHVIDVFSLQETSTIDLQYINQELEGLDVYDGNLVLHTINNTKLQKFVF